MSLMKTARTKVLLGLFRRMAQGPYNHFCHQLNTPDRSQAQVLKRLMHLYAATDYGKRYSLTRHTNYAEFCQRVPLVTYDDLLPWLQRDKQKGLSLVPERIKFYEPTSGSSGKQKLIPYTRSLQTAFMTMFKIWSLRTLNQLPALKTGKTFISVSSSLQSETHGLRDDADYLTGVAGRILAPMLVRPQRLSTLNNPGKMLNLIALSLVLQPELEIISIWNPSYLAAVLEQISSTREAFANLILQKSYWQQHIPLPPSRYRQSFLEKRRQQVLQSKGFVDLWPNLKLLSCWNQALALQGANKLKKQFPHTMVEGKGLLATEAPMTVPWGQDRFVPLIGQIFFEVKLADSGIIPMENMQPGQQGQLVISQPAGLLRYQIGDHIVCDGKVQQTPTIRLTSRGEQSMDLVGEKLTESFIRRCLKDLDIAEEECGFLAVLSDNGQGGYVLLSETPIEANLLAKIESTLSTSHHYGYARRLGQLKPLKNMACPKWRQRALKFLCHRGLKLGDIKPALLIPRSAMERERMRFFG